MVNQLDIFIRELERRGIKYSKTKVRRGLDCGNHIYVSEVPAVKVGQWLFSEGDRCVWVDEPTGRSYGFRIRYRIEEGYPLEEEGNETLFQILRELTKE